MTEPQALIVPDAGDCRRAAALLMHYAQGDGPGVLAVLDETAHAGRPTELLLQLIHLVLVLMPALAEEPALGRLQEIVLMVAADE